MFRKIFAVGIMAALVLPTTAFAQMGPGGGMGGRGRNPKNRLGGLIRGIGDLEKGTKARLTKAQARSEHFSWDATALRVAEQLFDRVPDLPSRARPLCIRDCRKRQESMARCCRRSG